MKKIYYLGIVAVIGLALLTMSYTCSEDEGDDPTTEPTSDNTKPDNQTTDNNGTNNGTENNSNTENNGTENTNSSAFTEAEIAKANTAANIASLSQMEKDIILYCNLARLDGA